VLQKYDDLIRARFVELFGDLASPSCSWERFHLVDACANSDDIKCGPFGTQLSKDEYTDTGIALWEIPQINSLFKTEPTHYLSVEKATKLSAYSIVTGDIAMSRKGNVGKCAVFPEEYPNGIIHSDVLRIRVDSSKVNPIFMMCQLHYSGAVTRQIELVSSGAIMAGINVTKLKQIYIHIPPLKLQKQFAYFYNQVNKSKLVEATTIIPKGGFLQWR
jgi:type I restriction enzyme S subunit